MILFLAQSPSAFLHAKLQEIQASTGVPALAACMVRDDRPLAWDVVGDRISGRTDAPARLNDRFQIGSIVKTFTGTLVGRMVDRGEVRWDTTLAEMFPELVASMQPVYRKVTVDELMSHTNGMPYQPSTPESVTDERGGASIVARRYEYVKAAVVDPPAAEPGTKVVYGGGPILVASYLERKLGKPYEALMRQEVFDPLGMTRAGFGNASSLGRVDGPWEHTWDGNALHPIEPFASFESETRSCVGRNAYASSADMAAFASAHLRCDPNYLKPETWTHLHTKVHGLEFGPGWAVHPQDWGGQNALTYGGSNGKNDAVIILVGSRHVGWAVMTNCIGPRSDKALDQAQRAISDYLASATQQNASRMAAPR